MPGPKPGPAGEEAGGEPGDEFDDGRHAGNGLTYLDIFALLSQTAWGRNGLTLRQFEEYSDRQLLALLRIEWDDDGRLVSEASKGRTGKQAPSGSIEAAGRELPALESLGLSEREVRELLAVKPNVDEMYLSLFFQVWTNRGKDKSEIVERWRAHLASEN